MKNGFKKAGYFTTIFWSILILIALSASTLASYFAYDIVFVFAGQALVLILVVILMIMCILAKRKYNRACMRFAEYIVNNRKKEAARTKKDTELAEQIKNMQASAAQERENAVADAYEQGKNEGMFQAAKMVQEFNSFSTPVPAVIPTSPTEQVFYNEFGQPVLIRRKVKKNSTSSKVDNADKNENAIETSKDLKDSTENATENTEQ